MSKTYKIHRPKSIIDDAWLRMGNLDGVEISNPLLGRTQEEMENIGLREVNIMRQPEYLGFAAKVLCDIDVFPEQAAVLEELWIRPFPMVIASRGFSKTFTLALYATLKCALVPNTKVVGIGASFRQSRLIFEYMEKIWRDSPVLRSVCTNSSGPRQVVDRCTVKINDSEAIFVPLGNGEKIRGLRATSILADEYASIPPDVFETVVRGFGAVSASPVDKVKQYAKKKALEELGEWDSEQQRRFELGGAGNQCILTGTADYSFMHFAEAWRKYYVFIKSQGDVDKLIKLPNGEIKTLREYYPDGVPEAFDHRHYSIIRIPYELIPKGFMDDKMVASAKANSNKGVYLREYGACFPDDSDGFFRRSLIESCVASDKNPIPLPSGPVYFDASIAGNAGFRYVYGIDPAAEQDNFTIVILELHADHTRIVYGWSTNITDFQKRKKAGLISENDYYGFCARKVRNLMKVFPTEDIAMDAQGGGRAVLEAFHDPSKLEHGEVFLWPTNRILNPDKELPTDTEPGKHIVHMCQFANFDFTSMANHGTRKDFEDKALLFPMFDPVTIELAGYKDSVMAKEMGVSQLYDTLEDCVLEIEALKDELCTIVLTRTGTGVNSRDRWDTPETTTAEGKKTRMRKDRYSALIMANFIARSIHRTPASPEYSVIGGFSHQIKARNEHSAQTLYQGPDWFVRGMEGRGVISQVRKRSV